MGILGAMGTAVSGLRSQSYALENISGNIANSQTTGFKRVDTSFLDLIPDLPSGSELAGSVAGFSRLTNTVQGDLRSTGVATNMALNGEGFFVVQQRTGVADNKAVFGGADLFTRRGDFALDRDGYLVNGAGYYLKGAPIDPITGEVKGAGSPIQISSDPIAAKRSTEITYKANLPARPSTTSASSTVADSELMGAPPASAPAGYEPRVTASTASPPGVRGDDQSRFISQSVSGGTITVYNDVGTPVDLQLRWAKVSNASPETWNLFYQENSQATGATIGWRNLGEPITFNGSGQMLSATSFTLGNVAVDGTAVGNLTLRFGEGGLTQFSSASGLVQTGTLQQDGFSSGTLGSLAVTSDGRITGSYSNGRVVPLAALSIAQFNADNALKRGDGGIYEQTLESGLPIIGLNGSTIIGGNVEGSNTDIADEFSKMIVTQQAYSANTRVVSTSQQMLSDIINMVR